MKNYYAILGIHYGATEDEIKQAYHDLVRVWHPDRFAADPKFQKKVEEKLKEINEAYGQLKKTGRHSSYKPSDYERPTTSTYEHKRPPGVKSTKTPFRPKSQRKNSWFGVVVIIVAILVIRGLLSQSKTKATYYPPPAPVVVMDPFAYYLVIDHKSNDGVFFSKIQRTSTLSECEEDLAAQAEDMFDKKCVRDDGQYDDIFIRRGPIGEWYLLVQFLDSSGYAIILKNNSGKDDAAIASQFYAEAVKNLRPVLRKSRRQAYITLVSPQGK